MLWKVRGGGYVLRGAKGTEVFKSGAVIDDKLFNIKGQEYKLEPVPEPKKAVEVVKEEAKDAGKAEQSATRISESKEQSDTERSSN